MTVALLRILIITIQQDMILLKMYWFAQTFYPSVDSQFSNLEKWPFRLTALFKLMNYIAITKAL